jgi:preprotein translocase SecE subunit
VARNRKRANRRPARPQRPAELPPDAADPRANGRAEVEPAELEPEGEAGTESVQDEPVQIPQLEFSEEPLEDEPVDSEDEPRDSVDDLEDEAVVYEDDSADSAEDVEDEAVVYEDELPGEHVVEEEALDYDEPAVPARRGSGPVAEEAGTALAHHRGGPLARLLNFAQGSWRELQRVQWPDRRQVMQATGVVIGFVVVAGVFLGVADYLAGKLINFILDQ